MSLVLKFWLNGGWGINKREKRKEKREKRKKEEGMRLFNFITDFCKGIILGFLLSAVLFGVVVGVILHRMKVKEVVEYVERQEAIEILREDYAARDPFEFLETVPGVRRAADGAAADFERRRDEIIYRFRNRLAD